MLLSRRHFFLGSLALPVFAAKKTAPVRPNILLVVVDQLPAWMLGSYGNKEVRTPNLDRLAQAGTRFLNHFACAPAAEPGRATLLTGRTPMQPAGGTTLEKVLTGVGYECHTAATLPSSEVTADGQQFLDRQSAAKPFFLNVNYTDLRPPYAGIPQKYLDLYASQKFADYSVEAAARNALADKEMLVSRVANWRKVAAAVSALDDNVASLLARVHQKQLDDNTLVIFAASCGALLGRRGLWGSGDASDPVNMFDEVVKTPMVWNWPGHVPAQAVPVELVSAYDLLPTVCDMVGAEASTELCGRSYLPLATGKPLLKKQHWRTTVFSHYKNTEMARTARYKLILRNEGKGPNELYDLPADPGERTDQAANEQYVGVKTSLGAELATWKKYFSS